ncbi:3,4-dihydroxy-2-butanone-4-phosphate synthase [Nocardia callitridis]
MTTRTTTRRDPLATTLPEAITALRLGQVALVLDDVLDTGCDLVTLAGVGSASAIATMVRYGSGFLCATVDSETCRRLDLPPVTWCADADDRYVGSMRVAVDAVAGTTTGISAHDRTRTLAVLADPDTTARHLNRPGHVIPVLAEPLGVAVTRPNLHGALATLCEHRSLAFCASLDRGGSGLLDRVEGPALAVIRCSEILAAVGDISPRRTATGLLVPPPFC